MKSLLCLIGVAMMFSGGNCISQSRSCSTVNGRTICNEETSSGNMAGASSMAAMGNGGAFQQTNAGTGDSSSGTFSSSGTRVGNMPFGFGVPRPQAYGPTFGPQPTFGGFDPFAFAGLPNPMFGGGAFAFAGRR